MKASEFITEAMKQRLDAKCWKGKHKAGTKVKGGVRVNNCVPNEATGDNVVAPWGASPMEDMSSMKNPGMGEYPGLPTM